MIHQLKCETQYFEALTSGLKPFEIRKNDRDFRVGDFLALNEIIFDRIDGEIVCTGRCCLVKVMYILDHPRYLPPGYIAMSTRPCDIGEVGMGTQFTRPLDDWLRVPVYGDTAAEGECKHAGSD